ncbi:MAG TPA: hypothetical protein VNU95_16460 [Candidatus Acidoferrales bacterium]|nr:hypothetical protein [Candidatus Acidoferrales bacterium]
MQNGPAKIRPALKIGEAGMENTNAFPIRRFQFAPPQPLMLPNGLNEPLGGKGLVVQGIFLMSAHAPSSIKISW